MTTLRFHLWTSLTSVSFLLASACGGAAEDQTGDGDGDSSPSGGTGTGGGASGGTEGSGGSSGGASSGGASSGGSGSGGDEAGTGGDGTGGDGTGGDGTGGDGTGGDGTGGNTSCAVVAIGPRLAGAARSAGFTGTDAEYSELYSQPCTVASDCDAPCLERGGTAAFCGTHVCIDSEPDYCLPPTKWRSVPGALSVDETTAEAAVTSLSLSNGDDHDLLFLEEFGFSIPEGSTIVGIVASIRKAKDVTDLVTDYQVSLLRAGAPGSENYATSDEWPTELTEVEYGSPEDVWNEPWSPSDINDPGFGVAIGALPGENSGRAYVDAASITVYYQPPCVNP